MRRSRVRTIRSNHIHRLIMIISITLIFLIALFICFKFYLCSFSLYNSTMIVSTYEESSQSNSSSDSDILISLVNSSNESTNNIPEKKDVVKNNTNSSNIKNTTKIHTTSNGETYTTIGILNIPSLNIKYSILSSCSNQLLKISVCKYWGANPNEVGNCCIAGHNWLNSKFFSKLPNIKLGDTIEITDLSNKTLVYTVYNTFYVSDLNDTSCTSQLTNGHTEITLITCSNDSSKRFIVKARYY